MNRLTLHDIYYYLLLLVALRPALTRQMCSYSSNKDTLFLITRYRGCEVKKTQTQ